MAEDVLRDAFDILRRDKAATPEEGVRLSREGEATVARGEAPLWMKSVTSM